MIIPGLLGRLLSGGLTALFLKVKSVYHRATEKNASLEGAEEKLRPLGLYCGLVVVLCIV